MNDLLFGLEKEHSLHIVSHSGSELGSASFNEDMEMYLIRHLPSSVTGTKYFSARKISNARTKLVCYK